MTGRSAVRPPTFRNPAQANVDASPVYQLGSFADGYASIAGAPAARAKRIDAASRALLKRHPTQAVRNSGNGGVEPTTGAAFSPSQPCSTEA